MQINSLLNCRITKHHSNASMTLILTLKLNVSLQNFFTHERQCFYPSKRNIVPAHVMLFHQLPEDAFLSIQNTLNELTAQHTCQFVQVSGIQFLGCGNAYRLSFDQTVFLKLRQRWFAQLIPQDKQRWQPHVTVQNKVSATKARLLNQTLNNRFSPLYGNIIGFELWRYMHGPWQWLSCHYFC